MKKGKVLIPDLLNKEVGKRLREIRKAKGYTSYEAFANQHEINRVQMGRYENGEDMRISTLAKILSALDITWEEFFTGL